MFKLNSESNRSAKLTILVLIVVSVLTSSLGIVGLVIGGRALVNTTDFEYRLIVQVKDWFNLKNEIIKR